MRQGPLARALDGGRALVSGLARRPALLLLAPAVLFLVTFLCFPALGLLRISLAANPGGTGYGEGTPFYQPGTWTLDNYVRFFSDPYFRQLGLFTIEFGLIVCVVSTLVSYALAYQIYRSPPWLKSVLLLVVILPKFTNVLVLMYGLLVVFGTSGLVNSLLMGLGLISEPLPLLFNLFGVVLGETVLVMPYCVLLMVANLHAIDSALVDAAEGLGASRARAFLEVTLPLSMPSISASVLLSFMWGAGAFAAPYLLGKPELYPLAIEVDQQVNWRLNWAMGAAVAFVLMAIIMVVMVLLQIIQRKDNAA